MASYKQCIEAHCKWCIYDEVLQGSWRKQVEDCNARDCALWPVRPVTLSTRDKNRNKRIKVVTQ